MKTQNKVPTAETAALPTELVATMTLPVESELNQIKYRLQKVEETVLNLANSMLQLQSVLLSAAEFPTVVNTSPCPMHVSNPRPNPDTTTNASPRFASHLSRLLHELNQRRSLTGMKSYF
jgi:hypothetical protein